jgi:glycogen phosphorylase
MRESQQPEAVIAIVDDDPSVREGLSSLIRSAGLQVETFESAQEFLARPSAEAPSCLVLDLQLPGLSGLDLQKRMAEVGAEIPIVFLTGHGNIPASVQAMKAGAVEFLTKPFDEQDLLQAIQQAVERDRRTRPSLRVLIVDDSPEDALLVVQELAHSRFRVSWERVENESDYLRQLRTVPDLILADCTLRRFSALRALQLLQRSGLSIPFIVISGTMGEDTAVAMMKQGADDYVLKNRLSRLGSAVTHVLQGPGKIAYLSMEIALDAAIPTYSGGLGILAGDTVRAAADLRLPMVAVSLLHRSGYFIQRLDASGWQTEEPARWEVGTHLREVAAQATINIEGRTVHLRAWRYSVRGISGYIVPVYLLDTDLQENSEWDRGITRALYGGDWYLRLCQEVVLGIGGVQVLRALGHDQIDRFHMNEGHASFLTLALLQEEARKAGRKQINLSDIAAVRQKCIFTTHTPVPAGHDQFPLEIVSRVLGCQSNISDMFDPDVAPRVIGSVQSDRSSRPRETTPVLNMTYLALNMSRYINGVAKKHGEVSRLMFTGYQIDAITNGVHVATWTSQPFQKLYDRYIADWRQDNFSLRYAESIPKDELWTAHMQAKTELLRYASAEGHLDLDQEVFTIGFARRITAYKRPDLVFADIEQLRRISREVGRFQILCGGKAHPCDHDGRVLIQQIFRMKELLKTDVAVVFLANYDLDIAKRMVSGVDLWLNTPQPPLEASGTSGMKAALNGIPSLSVLDGWWIEGLIEGVTGWSIGKRSSDALVADDRAFDALSLYQKLEHVVLPMFYGNRDHFIDIMRHAIALNGSFFNTQRMLQQYVLRAYY